MIKKALIIFCVVAAITIVVINLVKTTTSTSTAASVANAFSKKYSKPASNFSIDVATDTGQFARGTVQFTDEPGGGVWFAAKTSAGWQLAFDGNGIIPCDIANQYNFPREIVSECIDTANSNNLIQRGSFVHDGTVIKDNPGFKSGVWYLLYEEPGSPGLSVELDLNSVPTPYISLTQGERVHVTGDLRGSLVIVSSITPIK